MCSGHERIPASYVNIGIGGNEIEELLQLINLTDGIVQAKTDREIACIHADAISLKAVIEKWRDRLKQAQHIGVQIRGEAQSLATN